MDEVFMKLAIEEARLGDRKTKTNPLVGAVLVKDGEVLSRGHHEVFGQAHAEVNCLKNMDARGATLYVTLEPCSHYGKTPPCADLIVEKGLKRVVIGELDSNPKVQGKGLARLKEAGIDVTYGVLEEDCHKLNEIFHFTMKRKRPYVFLKWAQSLDGKIATASGESQWITGEEARKDANRLRGLTDAILVGRNTASLDNPRLTCRTGGENPLRIVLDSQLKTPRTHALFKDQPTIFYVQEDLGDGPLTETARKVGVPLNDGKLSLKEILRDLYENQHVSRLMVEGGGQVLASFIQEGYADQFVVYEAPLVLGARGKPSLGDLHYPSLKEAFWSSFKEVDILGQDLKIKGGPECLLEL